MPELPEVETTRAGIRPHVLGRCVRTVVVRRADLRWPVSSALVRELPEQTLVDVHRRAKYLLFIAETGAVCLHLGMSGRLRMAPAETEPGEHDHLDIVLDNGWAVRFNDTRRFGSVLWLPGDDPESARPLAGLGPEPFAPEFDGDWLYARSRRRRTPVKAFIMDAGTVVGVGNIYASEALHAAGIHPRRPAGRIARARYAHLAKAIRDTLASAIAAGGTTLRDYIGVDGDTGYFQQALAVYNRAGQPCARGCGPIRRALIGQRSTFFCPACQR